MSIFGDTLRQSLDEAAIEYSPEQIELCEEYYKLVFEANKHMNLTRITDEAGAATQHFADAVKVLKYLPLPQDCGVLDIGTGAGFPGMPIKILRPGISLTLLDSSAKKTEFVRAAAKSIGIDVTVVCARAEEAAKGDMRECFDAALSRAVAPLNMLLELCIPFVKTGGTFAAWKGESFEEELSNSREALKALGCAVSGNHFINPGAIILIQKQKPTPDIYPRRFSKIKSNPL